jgi:6-phosphofructokinase 1
MPTIIRSLGECTIKSPLHTIGGVEVRFRHDSERVLYEHTQAPDQQPILDKAGNPLSFEQAGPRENLFFDPLRTTVGIVTCGGLCPGLNDIIKGLVTQLWKRYGCQRIYGFQFGYQGLIQRLGHRYTVLQPDKVKQIHLLGGSILGTSRGNQPIGEMVDTLEEMKVDILFVVGGDGTMRGADLLTKEIERRKLKISIVGIPKTIDNDIQYLDKSFGFETAFAEAVKAIRAGHTESEGAPNGIGLVKLMGRDSGFIASYAALADGNVDFVLIPEVPFVLDGPRGFLEALRHQVARRKSAVIVVAEGAGQELMEGYVDVDPSGNQRPKDIGVYLRDKINAFFKERRIELNLKYIDPSYTIRSVPANAQDNFYCQQLAQHAVHAAMAGKTGMLVGRWHTAYVHLPIEFVSNVGRRTVDSNGELWRAVLESTNQPASMM